MSDRSLARLGVLLAFAYVVLAVIAIVLAILTQSSTGTIGLTVGLGGLALVGSILAARRPRNPIGWLFLGASLGGAALEVCVGLVIYGLVTVPGSISLAPVAGSLTPLFGVALLALLFFSILLFPTGRLPSARWRPIALAGGLFILATALLGTFGLDHLGADYPDIKNPLFIPSVGPIAEWLAPIFTFSFVPVSLAFAVASLVSRYGSASFVERQQLKWVVLTAVVMVALLGASAFASPLREALLAVALNLLPAGIAIAILRHQLYDIDHLIKRTLVYGGTTGLIAGLSFGGIVALQPLLRPLTSGTELAIAASTLAAFALFQPIRRRIQRAVDRRFDRSRYDAARTLEGLSDELRDEVDLERVQADLLTAVSTTMAPQHVSLWLRSGARGIGSNPVTISGRPAVRKELA
jgi:hypothetical protein